MIRFSQAKREPETWNKEQTTATRGVGRVVKGTGGHIYGKKGRFDFGW